jgi:hypothetical protein
MKLSWLNSLLVVLGACCCGASATEASLILVNAKLWTENPAQPPPMQWRLMVPVS